MILKPPSVLLMAPAGAGKTTALPTYVEAGVELFVLITEPNGADSLIDACKLHDVDIDKVHWTTVSPVSAGWDALEDMATKVKAFDYESITKIKGGVGKQHQEQFMAILKAIQNFHCERTGKEFGDVTEWDHTRAFALDSLSGLNRIAMDHTIGYKPAAHQGEWGIAMNLLETLMLKLTSDMKCHFAVLAHVDRETDEITNIGKITVSSLGRKLGPKLIRFFSEVVLAKRNGSEFLWSTEEASTDVKNRALPISARIEPSFVQIVRAYEARLSAMGKSLSPNAA